MKKNIKGFTLVELLVVIAIIGLLSTLAVVSLNSARTKARDARIQSDLKQISTAFELRFSEANSYPTNVAGFADCAAAVSSGMQPADNAAARDDLCCGNGQSICFDSDNTDNACDDAPVTTLLQAIPCHPINTVASGDIYYYEGTATTYCISGQLSNGNFFTCSNGSCFNNAGNNCTEL